MKHFKNINLAALILVGAVLALGVLFGVIAFPKESLAGLSFVGFAFGTVYTEANTPTTSFCTNSVCRPRANR